MKARRGFSCYMAIVMRLHEAPAVTSEVAAMLDIDRNKAIQLLNELRTLHIVRREPIVVNTRGNSYRWSLGADADVRTQRLQAARPRAHAIQFAVFFRGLQRPVSVVGLARQLGVRREVVNKHVARARNEHAALPIVDFAVKYGQHPTPLYQFAPGQPDAVYQPKTAAQVNREARQRKREQEERRARLLSRASNSSIFAVAASMAA